MQELIEKLEYKYFLSAHMFSWPKYIGSAFLNSCRLCYEIRHYCMVSAIC